ncbi:MAG: hypothetical protein ACK4MQ_12570 [Hyphomonas sp.]
MRSDTQLAKDGMVAVALMQRAAPIIRMLINAAAEAGCRWTAAPRPEAMKDILARFVLPAEAALRRLIRLIASCLSADMPVPRPRQTCTARPARAAAPARPRTPVFRLGEAGARPPTDKPRPQSADPRKAPAPIAPAILAERLSGRLIALNAALRDPVGQARRWLRAAARGKAPQIAATCRAAAAPHPDPQVQALLTDLHAAATNAVFDTS